MLELTDDAVKTIQELVPEGGGLRLIAVEEGGEATLDIEPADGPTDGDVTVERDGAKVFLNDLAAVALDDQILGIEPHGDHVHFTFDEQSPAESG